VTADLRAHLDRLDTALTDEDALPWRVDPQDDKRVEDASRGGVTRMFRSEDAVLVVAAVNALPGLLAAVRAAADLVAFYDRHEYSTLNVDDLRTALAATLTEGDAP
jgi:hypothetical protein